MLEKTIIILGGTGFIGRSFKEFYLNKSTEVLAPSRQELNLLNRDHCKDYFDMHKPDIVIFSAVNVASLDESMQTFYNVLANNNKFGRMICFGSGSEYNPKKYTPLMSEHNFTHSFPENGYPLAKFMMGREIEFGPCDNVINLRLFGVYGKYEDYTRRFISNNICRILSELPISMNRDMKFDYIYVNDLCQIVDQLITTTPLKERSYNLCSGNPVSLKFLADKIVEGMEYDGDIIVRQEGMNPEYTGDPRKFFNEFGVFDFTPHSVAIENMIEYFEAEFNSSDRMRIVE